MHHFPRGSHFLNCLRNVTKKWVNRTGHYCFIGLLGLFCLIDPYKYYALLWYSKIILFRIRYSLMLLFRSLCAVFSTQTSISTFEIFLGVTKKLPCILYFLVAAKILDDTTVLNLVYILLTWRLYHRIWGKKYAKNEWTKTID